MTRRDAFSSEAMRIQMVERNNAFLKALEVHAQAQKEHNKLADWVFEDLIMKSSSPYIQEMAIKNGMNKIIKNGLRHPDCTGETDCTPVASSVGQYIFNSYSAMLSIYRQTVDHENMNRLLAEFENRISDQYDKDYALERMTKVQTEYLGSVEQSLEAGTIYDIATVPEAYRDILGFWDQYIYRKGGKDHYQWDIRDDIDSPDGYKAKKREKAQKAKEEAARLAAEYRAKQEQARLDAERKAEEARLAEVARIKAEQEAEAQRIQVRDERIKLAVIAALMILIAGVVGLFIRRRRSNN